MMKTCQFATSEFARSVLAVSVRNHATLTLKRDVSAKAERAIFSEGKPMTNLEKCVKLVRETTEVFSPEITGELERLIRGYWPAIVSPTEATEVEEFASIVETCPYQHDRAAELLRQLSEENQRLSEENQRQLAELGKMSMELLDRGIEVERLLSSNAEMVKRLNELVFAWEKLASTRCKGSEYYDGHYDAFGLCADHFRAILAESVPQDMKGTP